jgi:F-type H+-transporting ATPase subunit epsilon
MAEALPTQLELIIVTPDRQVVRDKVASVSIPGKTGYLGILPGHAPLLTELDAGQLSYSEGRETTFLAVTWGFAEVLPGRVIVLANTAERAEEIDLERATRAKQRAEERLKKLFEPEIDQDRAREAFRRAIARIETARHAKSG